MRHLHYLVAGLIVLMLGTAIHKASRPDAGLLKFRVADGYAYGNGITKGRSLDDFRRFLRENPDVHTLVLGKMSGTQDLVTNTKIARLIRKRGLNTHLNAGSYIASGAVDLFLAGERRTMDCGALIGVHSWRQATPDDALIRGAEISPRTVGVDRHQASQERFLTEMGVDPAFYVFTREAAPPDDIYLLKTEDINRFGILTEPSYCP